VIALDLSRLLSRAGRGTPTGIDRVELAYAEHLIAAGTPRCFAALTPDGRLALLPRPIAEDFVREIAAAWRGPLDPRDGPRLIAKGGMGISHDAQHDDAPGRAGSGSTEIIGRPPTPRHPEVVPHRGDVDVASGAKTSSGRTRGCGRAGGR